MSVQCHPCFDPEARHQYGRVHLPVAPKCNVGCNFCNRKFDCLNESRPGVSSTLLTPEQSLTYLNKVVDLVDTPITVVGIAGPGDPFANADKTMRTLRLVREHHPSMLLCVASNGLEIAPHVEELAELKTSHVTLTINAIDPQISAKIYRFARLGRKVLRGIEAAEALLDQQLDAIDLLKSHGMTVKVNSIVMPGINDHHIPDIARLASRLEVDYHNCMALYPLADTPFADLDEPDAAMMTDIRDRCGEFVPQMEHCQRCRADAAGMLGEDNDEVVQQALTEAASAETVPSDDRPYVAVTSFEGLLINQHLGESEQLWIFGRNPDGSFRPIETRPTPLPGSGESRWDELAARLDDCSVLLCGNAGQSPKVALAKHGVRVLVAEGMIEDALHAIYQGQKPRMPARVLAPASGCDTDGVGCGGCPGSGTGCG
ncbi:radical SAM protein [Crateriforma spongiae]|uniref:radical SAM protein n=1 Tax=Crateriforma spongiae TaxID=2724528 RepID=UPI00144889AF|nr:radical SAM protein [Crateriforma spongiae]